MKPLAQVRLFLGREFSLPLPPNFQTRFLIADDLKEKCDHVINIHDSKLYYSIVKK
jgi:hypothetical protein